MNSLKSLLAWHVDSGTDGLCVLGTTGEAATMSMAERASVLELTREVCGDGDNTKLPYMVGCGAIDPDVVAANCKQAAEYGAAAALVVTPYYVKPTPLGLVQFYKRVCDNSPSDLPIILYNVPGRTACDMTAATAKLVVDACGYDRVIGCKEATGDVARVAAYHEVLDKDRFKLWSGDDATSSEFVLKGGDGCISVTANVVPERMKDMMDAALDGKEEAVRELNGPLVRLHDDIFLQPNPIPAKYILNRMGMIRKGVRVPLHEMEERFREKVDKAAREAGCELFGEDVLEKMW